MREGGEQPWARAGVEGRGTSSTARRRASSSARARGAWTRPARQTRSMWRLAAGGLRGPPLWAEAYLLSAAEIHVYTGRCSLHPRSYVCAIIGVCYYSCYFSLQTQRANHSTQGATFPVSCVRHIQVLRFIACRLTSRGVKSGVSNEHIPNTPSCYQVTTPSSPWLFPNSAAGRLGRVITSWGVYTVYTCT